MRYVMPPVPGVQREILFEADNSQIRMAKGALPVFRIERTRENRHSSRGFERNGDVSPIEELPSGVAISDYFRFADQPGTTSFVDTSAFVITNLLCAS